MIAKALRDARILIVDDEPVNVRLMERLLQEAGFRNLASTSESATALDLYRRFTPDLTLVDLMMPHPDGMAVLRQLRAELPEGAFVPVLVLTIADATADAKRRALQVGARDFLTKPFEPVEVLLRIRNVLETQRLHVALDQQNRAREASVRQRTEPFV